MPKKFYIKEDDTEIVLRLNASLVGSTAVVSVRPAGALTEPDVLPSEITNATKGELTISTETLTPGAWQLQILQEQAGFEARYPSRGFDLIIVGENLDA